MSDLSSSFGNHENCIITTYATKITFVLLVLWIMQPLQFSFQETQQLSKVFVNINEKSALLLSAYSQYTLTGFFCVSKRMKCFILFPVLHANKYGNVPTLVLQHVFFAYYYTKVQGHITSLLFFSVFCV